MELPVVEIDVYKKAKKVFPLIMRYLSTSDKLRIRRICKTWNVVFMSICKDNWTLYVCNDALSIDVFANLSDSFQITNFKFQSMDLEACFFGYQNVFRNFTLGHCLRMKSLSIVECDLNTGRFLELLAFCKQLKKLTILNTPSIYKVKDEICVLNWAFCFKTVRRNLAQIENLSMSETTGLSICDIYGLTEGMTNLKVLEIGINTDYLPITAINRTLNACSQTLSSLTLRGEIPVPGLDLEIDVEMVSLCRLVLLHSNLEPQNETMKNFKKFLKRCPQLNILIIQHSHLERNSLSAVQTRLQHLDLMGCDFDGDAFHDASFENLVSLKLQATADHISEPSNFEYAAKKLLGCIKPKLETLALELSFDSGRFLRRVTPENYPKLKHLSLNACVDFSGQPLRAIFKSFSTLESLSLTDCGEIIDESLCPIPDSPEVGCLTDMKGLKVLNLDGTSISDKTVHDCILKMESLERAHLNNTNVLVLSINILVNTDCLQSLLRTAKVDILI